MDGFKRVVFAIADPKMGCLAAPPNQCAGAGKPPMEVARGVMEAECRDLLQAYFRLKRRSFHVVRLT